ncbi:glyoxalase superfamily protein [Roseospira navarrensis]|uniref:Bleomycin resistance protein n=1 Tax=Roseospira navarrensis TaxID=140058 RepID=A0A7X1ZHW3_9PROT|nr:glyoxalase superfamily protein [Roseospira navarrensis]MQX37530.1 VOC family protein [Roseospira navarrensis]
MPATFTAIPILRIFDEAKALDFYGGFLGFAVDWRHRLEEATPLYMQVSRGGMRLHLTEHHGDCTPGGTVFVAATGLAAYHAEISAKGYGFNRPGLDPAPWGGHVMEATDPFGNRLRFWEEG